MSPCTNTDSFYDVVVFFLLLFTFKDLNTLKDKIDGINYSEVIASDWQYNTAFIIKSLMSGL